MAKRKSTASNRARERAQLFRDSTTRRRRSLILPRYLADEADKLIYRGERQDRAQSILKKWLDLEVQGQIFRKETAVDADFLLDVFGRGLGYPAFSESPEHFELDRNFTVPGIGTADGALGNFVGGVNESPIAVIELKDADTDIDRDKFNGRTAVQQCWDYLNALPGCPWGIVSNFVTFRLYHRDKTPLAYEEFSLRDLGDAKKFRQFYCLFERGGLIGDTVSRTRAPWRCCVAPTSDSGRSATSSTTDTAKIAAISSST